MRVSNKGLYPKRKPPLFRGGHYLKTKSYNRAKKSCEVFPMFHKEKPDYNRRQYGFYMIDELVPKDHFLRQVDSEVDFDFGMFKYQKNGEMDSEYPFLFCSKSGFWWNNR